MPRSGVVEAAKAVAAEVRAGRCPAGDAAIEAVLERSIRAELVNEPSAQALQRAANLRDILLQDPGVVARVKRLLADHGVGGPTEP